MSNLLGLLPKSAPAWSEATKDSSVGVDFLGTRQANLDMLGQLTGVYNNQIRSARQHAILAWAAWRFLENAKDRDEVTPAEFVAFLDAVETVQLVGQLELGEELGSFSGGLGSGSWKNLPTEGAVPLRFSEYGRTHETSALAAVQYGPSAKIGGLGFIAISHGIPVPTERGRRLALSLDGLLRKAPSYGLLTRRRTPAAMSREDALALARCGLLIVGRDAAPRPERHAYVDAVFGFDGGAHRDLRAHTMALLLHLADELDGGEGVDPQDIRVRMLGWQPERHSVPGHLREVTRRWQVFQVRQLQRFALESLLGLAERWMHRGILDLRGMLDELGSSLISGGLGGAWTEAAQGLELRFSEPLVWASGRGPWKLVWDELQRGFGAGDDGRVARAAVGLLGGSLALYDACVAASGELDFASMGGRPRISLVVFREWWRRRDRFLLREVIGELLEELVLQQHIAVAVSRYDNANRRLRFSMGERGWELLPGTTPSTPGLTGDRIEAAMALLNDLALLVPVTDPELPGRYRVSADGREVGQRFARQMVS